MNKKTLLHFYLLSVFSAFLLGGCCFGKSKCQLSECLAKFRIVNAQTRQDLAFGPSRKYNPAEIKLYAINGGDTVLQYIQAGPNPNPGGDSLLFASFDYRKPDMVFIWLNNTDTDTLQLFYQVVDASPCCPDYTEIQSMQLNHIAVEKQYGGISILKK